VCLAIAPILLVALAGCRGDKLDYHRVEFPGFSLEVPTTIVYAKDLATEYRAGQAEAKDDSRLVTLSWHPGAHMTVEEAPAMVRAMSEVSPKSMAFKGEPGRAIKIGGHDATQIDARIGTGTGTMSLTDIACGKRAVMVGVIARFGGQAVRERILGSFDCHPIAAQDASLSAAAAAPFGIDDPALLAGWHRRNDGDQFAMSNGELLVVVTQRPRNEDVTEKLDQYLPTLLGAAGWRWTGSRIETRQAQGGERTFHHGRISMEGETANGVVTVWNCPGRTDAVMVFALSMTGGELTPAVDLLAKLRCVKPDDPPLPLAPAPPEPPPPGSGSAGSAPPAPN